MARKKLIDTIVGATNTVEELLGLYVAILALSALGFSYFEHKPLGDAIWWAIVTSTTTGYGDLSPVTWEGRLIGAGLMLVSILFILPLLIGYIASHLIVNKNEFTDEEQEEVKRLLREIRTKVDKIPD